MHRVALSQDKEVHGLLLQHWHYKGRLIATSLTPWPHSSGADLCLATAQLPEEGQVQLLAQECPATMLEASEHHGAMEPRPEVEAGG